MKVKNVVIFDTNVLLDLYMLSRENSELIIGFFKDVNAELYITETVYNEFKKNHHRVKSKTGGRNLITLFKKDYELRKNTIDKSVKSILNNKSYKAFETNITETTKELIKYLKTYKKSMEKEIDKLEMQIDYDYKNDDPVNRFVEEIVQKNKFKKYKQSEKIDLSIIAEQRIKLGIKPGLTDVRKDSDMYSKYADIFIWFEILEHSKKYDNVLFLQNETKEDWWEIVGEKAAKSMVIDWRENFDESKKFEMISLTNYLTQYEDMVDIEALAQLKKLKEDLSNGLKNLTIYDERLIEKIMDSLFDLEDLVLGESFEGGNISTIENVEENYNKDTKIDVLNSITNYENLDRTANVSTTCTLFYTGDVEVSFDKDSIPNYYNVEFEINIPIIVDYQIMLGDSVEFEIENINLDKNKSKVNITMLKSYHEEYDHDEYDWN